MERIERDRLKHFVMNALQFAQPADRRKLERDGILLPGEAALDRVAQRVCDQLDNASRGVFQIAPPAGIPFTEFCDRPCIEGTAKD